ncbi:NfeD family protein [Reichenbachiella versicolor]|uniref:NfeD family protein n=1 Tax=Reichenbachiella versicolor TaxID=1821036 RepID=UPI0013A580E0|nr:NfeD family protein [Reichenbachiella versicolor]
MTDWILISTLILGGIGLIILEIIFVPGTTVVGFFGFGMSCYGIYRVYELFGAQAGHITLTASLAIAVISIVYSFKSNAWKKFANNQSIKAKVNEDLTDSLAISDEGISKSSLKPIGKAEFGNKEYEVTTIGQYLEENTPVRIIKIERNKIIVEPII